MKNLLRLLFILLLTLPACLNPQEYTEEELQALVDAELGRKVQSFRDVKMERCREALFIRANFIVDSLLFVQTQRSVDSLFVNANKKRPDRPEMREILDDRPVAPLFDTIILDSLPVPDSILEKK